MRSSVLRVAVCLWTVVTLGIGNAEASSEKITLRVSGLPSASSDSPEAIKGRRVMARFLELNPDIELQSSEGLKLPNVVDEAATVMMIAGGIPPDVLQLNFRSLDTYARQGLLAPLDDYAAQAKAQGIDVADRMLPQVRKVVYGTGPDGEKHFYALPWQFSVMGLFYNKELFRKAGLPDRGPKDWVELAEFSKTIAAVGPGHKGLYFPSGSAAAWILINFIWSAGGEAVQEVSPDDWRACFNTPPVVTAYKFYYQLVEIDRTVRRGARFGQELWDTTGMWFGYVGDSSFDEKRFGFSTVPKGPTGLRGSEINSQLLAVYSQIKDPRVKDAAWRYILFWTGPEAERIRTDVMVELGQAAQVNPASLRKFGYERYLSLTPAGFEEDYAQALADGHPEPYGKNCNLVYAEMSAPLDQILLSKDIRKAWESGDQLSVEQQIQKILNTAVVRTNEQMIGFVAPEVMKFRRIVAAIVVACIVLIFAAVGFHLTKVFSQASALASRAISGRSWVPWTCLLPALGLILVWSYVPLLRGTVMAFQDYRLVLPSVFIGLDNFASVLFDPTFWFAMLATLHFAAYTLTLGFVAPILLAFALHLIPKYKVLYRTVYYLPAIISGTAVFFLWFALFGQDGPLNLLLRALGFSAQRAWTDDPYLAMISCVIPGIWAGAGPGCLIYLAALKTIPEEQFEASEIDGAGFWHKTLFIVYPGLKALIFINFVGAIAAAFHGASNILIMTGGGPNRITEVISLKLFFEAFTRLRFGPATAMAWVLGSMLIGLTVIQLKKLSQMEFKTSGK